MRRREPGLDLWSFAQPAEGGAGEPTDVKALAKSREGVVERRGSLTGNAVDESALLQEDGILRASAKRGLGELDGFTQAAEPRQAEGFVHAVRGVEPDGCLVFFELGQ